MTRFMDILADIMKVGYKPSEYVQVSLIPPVVLILQLVEMTLGSVGNILNVFTNVEVPFDPYYFLQRFVPYLDWIDFKQISEKYEREKKTRMDAMNINAAPPTA